LFRKEGERAVAFSGVLFFAGSWVNFCEIFIDFNITFVKGGGMKRLCAVFVGVLGAGVGAAATLQIPYVGGKQIDSVKISMADTTGFYYFGVQAYTIIPDTLKIGNVFSLAFHHVQGLPPHLCSMTDAEYGKLYVQVFTAGTASRLIDSGFGWSEQDVHPPENSLVALDTLPSVNGNPVPMGFIFAKELYCEGTYTHLEQKWNRVIYIRNGGRYAKVAVTANEGLGRSGLGGSFFLTKITVRYIINDANELGAPVAIRAARSARRDVRLGAKMEYDLYNPLGVRLASPRSNEPALPSSRSARPLRP
jgi:hypothetical protein